MSVSLRPGETVPAKLLITPRAVDDRATSIFENYDAAYRAGLAEDNLLHIGHVLAVSAKGVKIYSSEMQRVIPFLMALLALERLFAPVEGDGACVGALGVRTLAHVGRLRAVKLRVFVHQTRLLLG